jgi:HAD superfamily phosphatase (TIGR01668 family)
VKASALILDLDNTLSMHDNPNEEYGIPDWLAKMRKLGVKMVVASNNNHNRVKPLADKLGLKFVSFACKPLTHKLKYAADYLGVPKKRILLVGDQIFTDVLAGKFFGVRTVLVEPFEHEDKVSFKFKRVVEDWVFDRSNVVDNTKK